MIAALGSPYDDIGAEVEGLNNGTWGSTNPNVLGGSKNRAAPGTLTDGVSLAYNPHFGADFVEGGAIGARTSGKGTNAAAAKSTYLAPSGPAIIKAVSPGGEEGLPRAVVIGGAAVVGLGLLGLIVYKLRKKH